MKRAKEDLQFRAGLLIEAIERFLSGDVETGKTVLGNYINVTIGFRALSKQLQKKDSSLRCMLGPSGNPAAENLFAITQLLQRQEGVKLKVVSQPVKKANQSPRQVTAIS